MRRSLPLGARLGLVALVVGWIFAVPGYWVFLGTAAIPLAIAALGLVVLVGWAGEVSVVQAGLTGTAVYLSGYAFRAEPGWGWPFAVAALVGIAATVALSLLLAAAASRLSGIYVLVLTLGMQLTIERVVFTNNPDLTGGLRGISTPRPWLPGVNLDADRPFYLFCLAILGVVLVALARLRASRFGRALLLVGTDRRAAASLGVSPWRYKTFAFVVAGGLAGIAGSLIAPLMSSPPSPVLSFSTFNSLFVLSIAVVAGFGSLLFVVAVAVAFTLVPMALEGFHVSPLILGGAALASSTALGRAGVFGYLSARIAAGRHRDVEAAARQPLTPHARGEALDVLRAYLRPPDGGADALDLDGVSVSFGGLRALAGVSLTVGPGEWVGLIGPNGSGKSTLLDVAGGLLRPDRGTVALFGADVTARQAWDRAALGLGRTFQSVRIDLHQTVSDNLLAGAYTTAGGSVWGVLAGRAGSWAGMRRAEEAARAISRLLAIDRYWDVCPAALSYGNRRRVEIGRSLMAAPRLLLLDEPTAGLDPDASALLLTLLKQLQADLGLAVLLVEHYVPAVLEHSHRIYVLAEGKVVTCGTPAEITDHPEVRSRYLGARFRLRGLSASAPGRAPAGSGVGAPRRSDEPPGEEP